MLSDVLSDAVAEIEEYQRDIPEWYDEHKDHIEIVKKVMVSLQTILDGVPRSYPVNYADTLSEGQKAWFLATCEAQIARWVECLRVLGPVTGEELVKKLDDAIQRQEALLANRLANEDHEPTEMRDGDGTPPKVFGGQKHGPFGHGGVGTLKSKPGPRRKHAIFTEE